MKETCERKNRDNVRKEFNQIITEQIGIIAKLDKIQFTKNLPKKKSQNHAPSIKENSLN